MATPADQRLLDLLTRWLESLELHIKYSSLDENSYWKIQPWSEHQRPNLWILNLAKQKTQALRIQVEQRLKAGDATFSDALELMAFLANLVGSEHLERFIPIAEAKNERPLTPAQKPVGAAPPAPPAIPATPAPLARIATIAQLAAPSASTTATREMPKFLAPKRAAPPAGTPQVARTERKATSAARPVAKPPAKPPPKKTATTVARGGLSDEQREQVIADATRLVQWGRKWFELPELIARMADRPALAEVRRILKENKPAIEKKIGDA
jgi:hypothetical protein